MTRILALSDLHFEFHADAGSAITKRIAEQEFDVLVIAGDLAPAFMLKRSLLKVVTGVRHRPVVFIIGNHEAYGSSIRDATDIALDVSAFDIHNLFVLHEGPVDLSGQRFIGETLWFRHDAPSPADLQMNDFFQISDADQIGALAKHQAAYLRQNIRPGDVVVTHHLPHPGSIAPRHRGSPLNRYFLHDVSDLVELCGAKLWIHGHTHSSCDYMAGSTRVVCNPLGYANGVGPGEPNPDFDIGFTVEI